MNIFPMIQPEAVKINISLPLYKEIDFNFKENKIVYKDGLPSVVSGKKAVLIWALKALMIKRTRYEIYSWSYGNEIEQLIGQPYTNELKQSEAIRYVRECLMINPYITDVADIEINFQDGLFTVDCKLITVYGEQEVSI